MNKFSIFQKIWFGVGILIVGCVISVALNFITGAKLSEDIGIIIRFSLPSSKFSLNAKVAFRDQTRLYKEAVELKDSSKFKQAEEVANEIQEIFENMLLLPNIDREPSAAPAFKKIAAEHKAYTDEAKKVYEAMSKGDTSSKEKADALGKRAEALRADMEQLNLDMTNFLQVRLSSFRDETAYHRERNAGILAFFVVLSLVLMAIIITRYVSKPLKHVAYAINEGAMNVADASAQVAGAGQSLSEGASNQASAIEETSSSLTEMAAMIKQNALNAGETDKLMKKNTGEILRQANEAMERLSKSIEGISGASEATRRIIKTIDEIAFQTNLLALNAAVEAARAGEAGAGFAVVADEVRALAIRAAEAAKETTGLIDNTIQNVNQGKEFAVATKSAFEQNLDLSNKAATLVSEIAAASNEQSAGIEQMNLAMSSIEQVVQQIAAHAEETASASEELNAQSASMRGIAEELVVMLGMKRDEMVKMDQKNEIIDDVADEKVPQVK
jgi:methyl-accepting chemotaxis protein